MKEALAVAPRQTPVSEFLPYTHHVTPTILATRSLEYLSIWQLGGRSFEGTPLAEQRAWIRELNNVVRGLGAGFGYWTHIVRRRVTEYPDSPYPQPFAQDYAHRYAQTFGEREPMLNELYLTVLARPVIDPTLAMLARFEKRSGADTARWQAEAIRRLDDANRTLNNALRPYNGDLLSTVERRGRMYSAPAEFLARLVNGTPSIVPTLRSHLADYMATCRPIFPRWGEVGELRGPNWSRRFGMVEIRDYPDDETLPGQLNELLRLPFEFVLSQSFSPLSVPVGLSFLKQHRRLLTDSGDGAASQVQQLETAIDDLASRRMLMGEHHATLTVWGETADTVRDRSAAVVARLVDSGIIGKPVDLALEAAWWAQLPGNWSWRPRPVPVTSLNWLCCASLHNYVSGKPTGNPWGPALTVLPTTSNTPFYFSCHQSLDEVDETGKRRLGNTMLIGQSGVGKTVILGHLLTQMQKFAPTVVVFDKDRGLHVAIKALQGQYFPLEMGVPTGWNPFQLVASPGNLAFLRRLVVLLARSGGDTVTTHDYREIARAVDQLMAYIDPPDRRLSTLLQFLPHPISARERSGEQARPSVHTRLLRWCAGGEYAWLLDNPKDKLDLSQHSLYGFDLTELFDDEIIQSAATTYLLYRTEQMLDGRKFAYFFDEVQHPLRVPYFQDLVQNKSRTIRKQNGILLFATQEPDAILTNPVGKSLVQQSATVVYLANTKATAADYIDGFKLTSSEFEMVRALGEFSRQFVIKQGAGTVTAELDLRGCDDALLVFSGSADMSALAEQAMAEVGDNPVDWLPIYLERARQAQRSTS